ncbi:MAG: ATP-binding protein [Desulfonauticus sp.]|nr:ATP-binding protein [Desulfonauticus sp.]
MKIEVYRRAPFVDREEEIDFLVEWFNRVPQRILWIYGPKSSGKTTLIEYVIEKRLLAEKEWWKKGKYWVKYINLRGKLIISYRSFLESFIYPEDVYREEVERDYWLSLKFIGIERKRLKEIRKRERDLFEEITEVIKKEANGKKAALIVDEIQILRDLYIKNGNGARELLKEFLNFCVRLTKETHLSHVAILTSNTIFIDRIYNDARLKETSEFWKVDHLKKERVREWLREEGFGEEEIGLVWEYVGGSISRLIKVIEARKSGRDLKEHLEREAWLAYTEIVELLRKVEDREVKEGFRKICEEILREGFYQVKSDEDKKINKAIEYFSEREILFYDPLELRVTGNSRVYEKAMERVIGP